MAKDFLAASGTGVPVERLFSSGPDVISNKQQTTKHEAGDYTDANLPESMVKKQKFIQRRYFEGNCA